GPTTSRLTAAGDMTVSGGTLDGRTLLIPQVIPQGASATLNGLQVVNGALFVNEGTTTWVGGTISFSGDSSFTNTATGTFDDQTDGIFGSDGSSCPVFLNEGTFVKSGGDGITYLNMELHNGGTVDVQRGTLSLGCDYVPSGTGTIGGSGSCTIRIEPENPV